MARAYTLVCDACGKKQTTKTQVLACTGRREDGMKVSVDLCMSCWSKLADDYGIHEDTVKARRAFEITPYDEIPKA